MTISSFILSSCGIKESPNIQLGVTESSAQNVASEVCDDFVTHILDKSIIEQENAKRQEEILTACKNIIEQSAYTGSGPKRFEDEALAYPIAFTVMNELHSSSGMGAPWGYEGAGLTKGLVGEMLEHGDELQSCVIGSSPECK